MNTLVTLSVLVPEVVQGATLLSSKTILEKTSILRRGLQIQGQNGVLPLSNAEFARTNSTLTTDAEDDDDDENDVAPPMPEDVPEGSFPMPPTPKNILSSSSTVAASSTTTTTTVAATFKSSGANGDDGILSQIIDFASLGSGILAPQLSQLLGPELGAVLPKLGPWMPALAPLVGSITKGESPDFSVLTTLPPELITTVAPLITKAVRDSPIGDIIPDDLLTLFEKEAPLIPKLTKVLPDVVPIIQKIQAGGNIVTDVFPMIQELIVKPSFIREISPLIPLIIENSPLGEEIPTEWFDAWNEFAPLLPTLLPTIVETIPKIENLDDAVEVAKRLRHNLAPVLAHIAEATGWNESEALTNLTELVATAMPLALDLTKVRSVEELKQTIFRRFATLIRLPNLVRKTIRSIFGDDEEEPEVGKGVDGPNHTDYGECADECFTKVSKAEFNCTKSPITIVHCLAVCEDTYPEDTLAELQDQLVDDYQFCHKKSALVFESAKGRCSPTLGFCDKFLAAMPEKYFIITTVPLDDSEKEAEAEKKLGEDSSAFLGTSTIGGAVFLLTMLF